VLSSGFFDETAQMVQRAAAQLDVFRSEEAQLHGDQDGI
jgi:hypothetical protein